MTTPNKLIEEAVEEFDKYLEPLTGKFGENPLAAMLYADTVKVRKDKLLEKIKQVLTKHEDAVLERGRLSVLQDFDNLCKADAFVGFTSEEWKAVQKFFEFNAEISGWKKELQSTTDHLRANQSDHEQTN